MTTNDSKLPLLPSLRLLLQDASGRHVAVPLTDRIDLVSGINSGCFTFYSGGVQQQVRRYMKALEQDTGLTTLTDTYRGQFLLIMSIPEIFNRAAAASKTNELLVDLTNVSGADAVVGHALTVHAPKQVAAMK